MITTGIIRSKYFDNNDTLIYKTELPVFKSPGINQSKIADVIFDCTACVNPGTYEPFNIGDKVYVSFVNNTYSQAVILGKIYHNLPSEEELSSTLQYLNTLNVSNKAILPVDTTIGDLSYDDLIKLKRLVSENKFNLEIIEKAAEGSIKLKGGTTGQVLSKISDEDFDYEWQDNAITPSIIQEIRQDISSIKDSIKAQNTEIASIKQNISGLDSRITTKIRTVESVPTDMRNGDYIFLKK